MFEISSNEQNDRAWNSNADANWCEMHRGMGGNSITDNPSSLEPVFSSFKSGGKRDHTTIQDIVNKCHIPEFTMKPSVVTRIRPSLENRWSRDLAEHLILSFSFPISFEVLAFDSKITCQVVTNLCAAASIRGKLSTLCIDSEIFEAIDLLALKQLGAVIIKSYKLRESHFFPLRTDFKLDPYGSLMGYLTCLNSNQFGALQVIIAPANRGWKDNIMMASRGEYDPGKSAFYDIPDLPKMANKKASKPIFAVSLRLAGSSMHVVDHLEGFLGQFDGENGFVSLPQLYPVSGLIDRTVHSTGFLLNSEELACLLHVPALEGTVPRLETSHPGVAPPENATCNSLVPLGISRYQGSNTSVGISEEGLTRHMAIFGATGTGKTTLLLKFSALAERGYGLAFLDPHGDAAEAFLSLIPENRIGDCVYFNPGDREFPPALNMLESSTERERQMLCSDLLVTFERLFQDSWGPRMEWILRQCINTLLVSGKAYNLRDINRLLFDEGFRQGVLKAVIDPDLQSFWSNNFSKLPRGSFDPIVNKLSKFVDDPLVRNIVVQPNLIDFHEIVKNNKIFIANLSKGILGEDVAFLIGSFILSKLQIATLSRAEIPIAQRKLYTIMIDEFQNYANDDTNTASMMSLLSEARKYGVAVIMATQFLSQLHRDVTAAIFGNVGTIVAFRCGNIDAQFLQKEFGKFTSEDIIDLGVLQAIVRMQKATSSFNIDIVPLNPPKSSNRRQIQELARKLYCRPRLEVEKMIRQSVSTKNNPVSDDGDAISWELGDRHKDFMGTLLNFPGLSVTELYGKLGYSAYMGNRVKNQLIENGYLTEMVTNLGAGSRIAKFLVPTPSAIALLGSPDLPGKGSSLHKFLQTLVANLAGKKGYMSEIEAQLTESGKSVDVMLSKPDRKLGVEISLYSKEENEVANIKRCFENSINEVIVVFFDEKQLHNVQKLAADSLSPYADRKVSFCILSDLWNVL